MCLMHNPPRHRTIEIAPLLTEPMYLIGPGANASALPAAKPGMRLDRLRLILPNRTHSLRMIIERAVAERCGQLDVAIEVDGYTTTKTLVAAGLGYTVLPYSAVQREVEEGQLTAVRLRQLALVVDAQRRLPQRPEHGACGLGAARHYRIRRQDAGRRQRPEQALSRAGHHAACRAIEAAVGEP